MTLLDQVAGRQIAAVLVTACNAIGRECLIEMIERDPRQVDSLEQRIELRVEYSHREQPLHLAALNHGRQILSAGGAGGYTRVGQAESAARTGVLHLAEQVRIEGVTFEGRVMAKDKAKHAHRRMRGLASMMGLIAQLGRRG